MVNNLKDLSEVSFNILKAKHPTVPEHALFKTKYSEKTANALTKAIHDLITFDGGFITRVNVQGQYSEKLKTWTKSTTKRGMSDLVAVVNGKFLAVEVKIGKDRQSNFQKEVSKQINQSGGNYVIANSFTEFAKWYNLVIKGGCHE